MRAAFTANRGASLRALAFIVFMCCLAALASTCARQPKPVPEVVPTRGATPASIASPSPAQSDEAPETATTEATPTLVATPSVAERFAPVSWFHYGIGGLKGLKADTFARPTGLAVASDGTLFVATAAHSHIFHCRRGILLRRSRLCPRQQLRPVRQRDLGH